MTIKNDLQKIKNKVLFQVIMALHKMGFMKTKFYKKYVYNSFIGAWFCDVICRNL